MNKGESYSIGLDFGSASMRCLLVDCASGEEIASASAPYLSGIDGVLGDAANPFVTRQNPQDYLDAMAEAVPKTLRLANGNADFSVDKIIGIGVDTTASTPIPVDESLTPIAFQPRFADKLNAQAWMWKDHSAADEANDITELARKIRPHYLAKCGETYSCECYWAKILHCRRQSPEIFKNAFAWLEFADFIPAVLCGIHNLKDVRISNATAAHKAFYSLAWGGFPDEQFLDALSPDLAELKRRLPQKAHPLDTIAGCLAPDWAEKLGLPEGIPVAVGAIDAHMGALGAGVGNGRMAKILGTSGVDVIVADKDLAIPDIPGILSLAYDTIMPGRWCTEAGQSAVGDLFNWFVKNVCEGDAALFRTLSEQAAQLQPGQSGLLALDWQNGSRSVIIDPKLSGLILGLTLSTTQAEIFRALIEATAFNARAILERQEACGLRIKDVAACGGIAEKSPLIMQIYADVINRPILIAASTQTCALGAAIAAMVAAGIYSDVPEAQAAVCHFRDRTYTPVPENAAVYNRLFELYMQLHKAFGVQGEPHFNLMKTLLDMTNERQKGE